MNQVMDALQVAVARTVMATAQKITEQATFNLGTDCKMVLTPGKAIIVDEGKEIIVVDGTQVHANRLTKYHVKQLLKHKI